MQGREVMSWGVEETNRKQGKPYLTGGEEMGKLKLLSLSCLVTLLVILFSFQGAQCFTLLEGKLEITGYLENYTGIRMENGGRNLHSFQNNPPVQIPPGTEFDGLERGDVSLFRNIVQLEMNYRLNDVVQVFGIWRAWYDASLDFNSDMEYLIAKDQRDEFTHDNDLREVYLNATPGNWRFRIGKQQIVWGESDGFRMADVINNLDYSWHYFPPPWQDIRIPVWASDIK
jgi:hypothetical protein